MKYPIFLPIIILLSNMKRCTTEGRNSWERDRRTIIESLSSPKLLLELGERLNKTLFKEKYIIDIEEETSISTTTNKHSIIEDSASSKECIYTVSKMLRLFAHNEQFLDFIIYSGKWLNDLGDYDGCLETATSKYITMEISGLPIMAALGLCGPIECSVDEYSHLTSPIANTLESMLHGASYEGTAMDNYHITPDDVKFYDPVAENEAKNQIGAGFVVTLLVFVLVVLGVVIGTVMEWNRGRRVEGMREEWERVQGKWDVDVGRRGQRISNVGHIDNIDTRSDTRGDTRGDIKNIDNSRTESIVVPLNEENISINRVPMDHDNYENNYDNSNNYNHNDISSSENNLQPRISTEDNNIEIHIPFTPPKEKTLDKMCAGISLIKNFDCLAFGKNKVDENTDVLNGVRVLAIFWVIYGHTFSNVIGSPLFNMTAIVDETTEFWMAAVMSGTMSVDVFFFLTAFLGVAIMYKQFERGIKATKVFLIYLHRYLRLLPVYIFTYMFYVWLAPIGSTGPMFQGYLHNVEDCYSNWWLYALYFNNFQQLIIPKEYNCMGWTWYLPCDMQFFLLIPWIVILYRKSTILTYCFLGLLATGSTIAQGILCYKYNLSLNFVRFNDYYFKYYYYYPYTRINPFLVGIIIGLMYAVYRDEKIFPKNNILKRLMLYIRESTYTRYIMYLFAFNITFWISFLPYWMTNYPDSWTQASDGIFLVLSRPSFVFGVGLFVLPVLVGRGKPLLRVFGFPLLNSLSKLVYAAYMLHCVFIELTRYGLKRAVYLSQFQIFIEACGYVCMSFGLALLVSLFFELPFGNLERLFLMGRGSARGKMKTVDDKDKEEKSESFPHVPSFSLLSNLVGKGMGIKEN